MNNNMYNVNNNNNKNEIILDLLIPIDKQVDWMKSILSYDKSIKSFSFTVNNLILKANKSPNSNDLLIYQPNVNVNRSKDDDEYILIARLDVLDRSTDNSYLLYLNSCINCDKQLGINTCHNQTNHRQMIMKINYKSSSSDSDEKSEVNVEAIFPLIDHTTNIPTIICPRIIQSIYPNQNMTYDNLINIYNNLSYDYIDRCYSKLKDKSIDKTAEEAIDLTLDIDIIQLTEKSATRLERNITLYHTNKYIDISPKSQATELTTYTDVSPKSELSVYTSNLLPNELSRLSLGMIKTEVSPANSLTSTSTINSSKYTSMDMSDNLSPTLDLSPTLSVPSLPNTTTSRRNSSRDRGRVRRARPSTAYDFPSPKAYNYSTTNIPMGSISSDTSRTEYAISQPTEFAVYKYEKESNQYSISYRHPLTVLQAFALSITNYLYNNPNTLTALSTRNSNQRLNITPKSSPGRHSYPRFITTPKSSPGRRSYTHSPVVQTTYLSSNLTNYPLPLSPDRKVFSVSPTSPFRTPPSKSNSNVTSPLIRSFDTLNTDIQPNSPIRPIDRQLDNPLVKSIDKQIDSNVSSPQVRKVELLFNQSDNQLDEQTDLSMTPPMISINPIRTLSSKKLKIKPSIYQLRPINTDIDLLSFPSKLLDSIPDTLPNSNDITNRTNTMLTSDKNKGSLFGYDKEPLKSINLSSEVLSKKSIRNINNNIKCKSTSPPLTNDEKQIKFQKGFPDCFKEIPSKSV